MSRDPHHMPLAFCLIGAAMAVGITAAIVVPDLLTRPDHRPSTLPAVDAGPVESGSFDENQGWPSGPTGTDPILHEPVYRVDEEQREEKQVAPTPTRVRRPCTIPTGSLCEAQRSTATATTAGTTTQRAAVSPLSQPVRGTPQTDAADITLRAAFETYLLPSIDGVRAKSTTRAYRTTLDHWEAFCSYSATTSSSRAPMWFLPSCQDPPVSQISDEMLDAFGAYLVAETPTLPAGVEAARWPEMKLSTAELYAKKIAAILRRVGPRETANKRGVGILDRVPAMRPMSELVDIIDHEEEGPVDITDDELGRIYDACDLATWPTDHAAMQWKTYLVVLSVMGPRVNDGATLSEEHFRMDAESPVRRSSRRHEDGWMVYVPTKTSHVKSTRLILPMPSCVRWHVETLLSLRRSGLFGWRDSTVPQFREQWTRIVEQAGLSHVQRRHMRSLANIRWSRTGIRDDLGKWVLGHAARDVNESHYLRVEPDLIAAAPRVEVPEAFNRRTTSGLIQPFLF